MAGTHVLTCNAGPGWSCGSCDNQSSCHSGRKCSFTTARPGAIIYYAFRQRELCQLQHGAAVSAISHPSPSQPFVPCSLWWIITGGQHIFQKSLSRYTEVLTHPRLFQVSCTSLGCCRPLVLPLLPPRALRTGEKQSRCTFLQGKIKTKKTSIPFTINIGYCVLLHSVMSPKACHDGKLHHSALNRPSCQRWALVLLLRWVDHFQSHRWEDQGPTPPLPQQFLKMFHCNSNGKWSKIKKN